VHLSAATRKELTQMKLRNTTDIPNDVVKEIIRFVKPPGITRFDVMLRNCASRYAGRAYTQGSGYHDNAAPFVVVRIGRDTRPRWETERDGKKFVMNEPPFRDNSDQRNWKRVNRPTYPFVMQPYQRGQLRGRRYYIANRLECLVWIMAHELRHLWQAKNKTRRGKAFGARGQFSEIDTESYAIRMLRAWRKHYRDLGAGVVDCPNTTPRLPASKADISAKRREAAQARLVRSFERNTSALKRWQTKEKRAVTAIKKLTRAIKRQQKTLAQKGAQ
jgi:hypothetical protein